MSLLHPQSIVILDFGGQYSHLIANRIRKLGAFSQILVPETPAHELQGAAGIILSGGPQSVYDSESPQADKEIFSLGIPILGICYGHQWMAQALGGKVQEGKIKEYGYSEIHATDNAGPLLRDLKTDFTVWMSHGDEVSALPNGFVTSATSDVCAIATMANIEKNFFGLQFHPEVAHTEHGMEILEHFLHRCRYTKWELEDVLKQIEGEIEQDVGKRNVFILVSGGVDSTVAFTLLNRVLGPKRVYGLLVDHGLMRKGEIQKIEDMFAEHGFHNLHIENASALFLQQLKGITDPEQKRQIIGNTFIKVQQEVAKRLRLDGPNWMLAQGTIYPDTIESGRTKHADQIKTHHNRVDQIEEMIKEGRVIEPLKELYKDEVRLLGERLGLPHQMVWRHPFPGPGLGVRILCAKQPYPIPNDGKEITVTSKLYTFRLLPIKSVGVQGDSRSYKHPLAIYIKKPFSDLRSMHGLATSLPNTHPQLNRVLVCTSHNTPPNIKFVPTTITEDIIETLQEADHVIEREMLEEGLYEKIWQFPVVMIPLGTKGGRSIVLRPVESQEAMTANAFHLSEKFLVRVTAKLLELQGIDIVFYDVTNKPPATIEWE